MTNYQLYARVLRLHHLCSHPAMTGKANADMAQIIREVILPDATLVWC